MSTAWGKLFPMWILLDHPSDQIYIRICTKLIFCMMKPRMRHTYNCATEQLRRIWLIRRKRKQKSGNPPNSELAMFQGKGVVVIWAKFRMKSFLHAQLFAMFLNTKGKAHQRGHVTDIANPPVQFWLCHYFGLMQSRGPRCSLRPHRGQPRLKI